MSDTRLNSLTRLALINPGSVKIVVFDASQRKYHALKDVSILLSESVISRLKSTFGAENVVIK